MPYLNPYTTEQPGGTSYPGAPTTAPTTLAPQTQQPTQQPTYPGSTVSSPQQYGDFVDIGLNVEGAGARLAPTFQRGDWEWYGGDPEDSMYTMSAGSGDSAGQSILNPGYRAAGWYMTDAARNRLGANWATDNATNLAWGGYSNWSDDMKRRLAPTRSQFTTGGWQETGTGDSSSRYWTPEVFDEAGYNAAYEKFKNENPFDYYAREGLYGKLKTSDKIGTNIGWARVGDRLVPTRLSTERWDTNNGAMNRLALASFAALLSAGTLAGPMLAGAGATAGGTSAGLVAGGTAGGTAAAGTTAGTIMNGVRTAADLYRAYRIGSGLYNAVQGTNAADDAADARTQRNQNINAAFGNYANTLNQQQYPGSANMPTQNPYTTTSNLAPGQPPQRTPVGEQGEPGTLDNIINGATSLYDIYNIYNSGHQNRDYAFNAQNVYNRMLQARQPYLDRLAASYTDPNSFYDSNEWQGLSALYKNKYDRQAAKGGNLANSIGREVALQRDALRELNNYRQGLTNTINTLNPNQGLELMRSGLEFERNAGNPAAFASGRAGTQPGGVAGQIQQTLQKLKAAYGSLKNVPDEIKKIFGIGADGSVPPEYQFPEDVNMGIEDPGYQGVPGSDYQFPEDTNFGIDDPGFTSGGGYYQFPEDVNMGIEDFGFEGGGGQFPPFTGPDYSVPGFNVGDNFNVPVDDFIDDFDFSSVFNWQP